MSVDIPLSTDARTETNLNPVRAAPLAILGKPTPKFGSIEHKTQLEIRDLIKKGSIKPNELNEGGTGIAIAPADVEWTLGDTALDSRAE